MKYQTRIPLVGTTLLALAMATVGRPHLAAAADRCNPHDQSTAGRSQCLATEALRAEQDVQANYDALVALIQRWGGVSPNVKLGLVETLKHGQNAWITYVEMRCSFEGDATMGSVGTILQPACHRDQARERAQWLIEAKRNFD
jgi:uncharacterized protein YecT (DUF1311 family)